jgi:hypothetical protein
MTTQLTADQLAEISERARREGYFVDPQVLHGPGYAQLARIPGDWAAAVLGRPFKGPRADTWVACLTLLYALEVEPDPQLSPAEQEQAAEAADRRAAETEQARQVEANRQQQWSWLREHLPVRVVVLYNYSGSRHLEFYSSGAYHIVVEEPLDVGRLHRPAGAALCTTPSRSHHQHFSEVRFDHDQDEFPTCRSCLQAAARLVGGDQAEACAAQLAQYSRHAPASGR